MFLFFKRPKLHHQLPQQHQLQQALLHRYHSNKRHQRRQLQHQQLQQHQQQPLLLQHQHSHKQHHRNLQLLLRLQQQHQVLYLQLVRAEAQVAYQAILV
jgi:hypothetical protein